MFDIVVSKFNQTSHAYTSHTWTQTHTRYVSLSTTTSRPSGRFSKAKAGLLSFAPRLVEVEVPSDVRGTVTEGLWFYIVLYMFIIVDIYTIMFFVCRFYIFLIHFYNCLYNHVILTYSANKLFILTFCQISPRCVSSGADRSDKNEMTPLAPIYIDIARSGNNGSLCDIVLCDWDNKHGTDRFWYFLGIWPCHFFVNIHLVAIFN